MLPRRNIETSPGLLWARRVVTPQDIPLSGKKRRLSGGADRMVRVGRNLHPPVWMVFLSAGCHRAGGPISCPRPLKVEAEGDMPVRPKPSPELCKQLCAVGWRLVGKIRPGFPGLSRIRCVFTLLTSRQTLRLLVPDSAYWCHACGWGRQEKGGGGSNNLRVGCLQQYAEG